MQGLPCIQSAPTSSVGLWVNGTPYHWMSLFLAGESQLMGTVTILVDAKCLIFVCVAIDVTLIEHVDERCYKQSIV